jgi:hypothetical protein
MLNDILGRNSQDVGFLKRNDELETVAKAYKKALLKVASDSDSDLTDPSNPTYPIPSVVAIIAIHKDNPQYPIHFTIIPIILLNLRRLIVYQTPSSDYLAHFKVHPDKHMGDQDEHVRATEKFKYALLSLWLSVSVCLCLSCRVTQHKTASHVGVVASNSATIG